jgi:hypothetical protein
VFDERIEILIDEPVQALPVAWDRALGGSQPRPKKQKRNGGRKPHFNGILSP